MFNQFRAELVADPFTPKFHFPIQNNIGLNFVDGLNFVACKQTYIITTLFRYRNNTGVFVDGPHFIAFSVKTCERGIISLAENISNANGTRVVDSVIWELYIRKDRPPYSISLRPCGYCSRNEKTYVITSQDCNKWEDFWLAWSKNAARLGLGRVPGENEVESLILHHETRPTDLHVVLGTSREINANWTIYRNTNFTSKYFSQSVASQTGPWSNKKI